MYVQKYKLKRLFHKEMSYLPKIKNKIIGNNVHFNRRLHILKIKLGGLHAIENKVLACFTKMQRQMFLLSYQNIYTKRNVGIASNMSIYLYKNKKSSMCCSL
ncbi:hypothetical protein ENBRE01_2477 [Enteropsectra breve]|nr:hypothetical protein ENBRE01_2477 [Enteropsectra breve]